MSLNNLGCPRSTCPETTFFKKDGSYFRKNDSRKVQRFQCKTCGKKFSKSTFQLECGQKKRRVNYPLLGLLASGVSQRRCALLLKINKKTVARKFDFLAKKYAAKNKAWLKRQGRNCVKFAQLDDLITIEHSKLKPLSVSTLINASTREILGVEVAQIPAFGPLAHISRRKYGPRENQHREALHKLFEKVKPSLSKNVLIATDQHQNYPDIIKDHLPNACHKTYKGEKGRLDAQGELKKVEFDPLFAINHTYAMFRANINRLFRKTWCTTKLAQKLHQHLEIYMWFHNQIILKK